MTSPRPSQRRVVAGLLRVLLVAGVLPLMAPTCGSLSPGTKTFSRNSLIIPMDVCYQSQTDGVSSTGYPAFNCPQGSVGDPGDVIKAYGLVYQLVRKNIAVYWVIAQSKTAFTDVDMSIQYNGGPPVLKYDWTANNVGSTAPTSGNKIEYRGGPFVIDGSDYAAALAVLNANKGTFSKVNVHVANVAFQGYVAKTMAGGWNAGGAIPPKLALLDIGSSDMPCQATRCSTAKNSELVIKGYLTRAGLDTAGAAGPDPVTGHGAIYDNLQMNDFLPDSTGAWTTTNLYKNGYQVLWVPHWEAPGSCSDCPPSTSCTCLQKYPSSQIAAALKSIGAFNAAGKDVFAECAGLGSFEGVLNRTSYSVGSDATRFQTTTNPGLTDINHSIGQPKVWGNYSSPLMQIGDFKFKPDTGAIQNFKAGAYKAETIKLISNQDSSGNYDNYDIFTMVPPSTSHGTVVYLGGHSYSGGEPGASDPFEIAGSRLVLNTLFNLGATCQQTGVACNTGLLGECSQGVMSCNDKGEPVCVPVKSPQPEVCDGKDNNCNGQVDENLDVACYDGPAGSLDPSTHQPRGICQAGVSSCVELSPNVFGMSTCHGQVLPADQEICNGLDNDCDGQIGNVKGTTTPLSQTCYTGPSTAIDSESGAYLGICKPGKSFCQSGSWSTCAQCDDAQTPWRNPSAFPNCQILPHNQICTGVDANYDMTCSGAYSCGCTSGATASCYDGPPATLGVGKCHGGTRTCSGGVWGGCASEVLPAARDCASAEDNDCNGTADNAEPACQTVTCPPEGSEVRICRATGAARYVSSDTLPAGKQVGDPKGQCKDGTRSCNTADGTVGDCTGTIYPAPEICDGQDNNCDGQIDENPDTLCNDGFTCLNGVCVRSNCGPEKPCPSGYSCNQTTSKCELARCGDDTSTSVTCASGEVCNFGACTDPCDGVVCPTGAICARGATGGFCTGGGCYLQGCKDGSCIQGQCEPDPCSGVACPLGTFCRAGDCVQSCVYVTCPADQICSVDGFCVTDPCRGVTCGAGKTCVSGACQDDPCSGLQGCGPRQTCKAVDGKAVCEDDPCSVVSCPVGVCTNGQCYPVSKRDSTQPTSTSTSSGGGCGCGSGGGGGFGAVLLLLLLPLLRRGRRPFRPGGGGRAALLGLAAVIAVSASACKGGSSNSNVDYSSCAATCDENQCIDLNYDPLHCGHCGTSCEAGQLCRDGVCGPSTAVAPYIRAITPDQGNHGLLTPVTVTLTGDRFQSGASVRVVYGHSSHTYTATVADSSHLSASIDLQDVPATELAVRVVNPDHVVSNAVPFDVVDVAPAITSVTPGSVLSGAVTTLTVQGTGFAATSICHFDGGSLHDVPMATTVVQVDGTPPALQCIFDATPSSVTTGNYALRVVNGTAASNDLSFSVVSPTPTLAGLSPSQGDAGSAVTVYVTGTGFDRTSGVYFQWGSLAPVLASTQYIDAAHLMVLGYVLPTTAGTAQVTVKNGSKPSTNSLPFKAVIPADSIRVTSLAVTPAKLYQGQTAQLTFSGSNFGTVSSITVTAPNGATVDATGVTSTATSATGTVDLSKIANGPAGTYSASVTFSGGTVSPSFQFQVLSSVPVLQSVTPAAAKQGSTPTLKIKAGNVIGTPTAALTGQGVTIQGTSVALQSPGTDPTLWQAAFNLNGTNTGSYVLTVSNGATTSNQISFTVLPGLPAITSLSPACAPQSSTPVTITVNGSNFALPDSFGNALTQVMYAVTNTTDPKAFQPIPATVTVNSSTRLTVVFDTRNAVADMTYYIAVWNPNDPTSGSAQHSGNLAFKVAASSCN